VCGSSPAHRSFARLADRADQWPLASLFDDDTTSLFVLACNTTEKMSLFVSYCRRLCDLREQIAELKRRSTPRLRSLQHALR
jgi:hypothetical protein